MSAARGGRDVAGRQFSHSLLQYSTGRYYTNWPPSGLPWQRACARSASRGGRGGADCPGGGRAADDRARARVRPYRRGSGQGQRCARRPGRGVDRPRGIASALPHRHYRRVRGAPGAEGPVLRAAAPERGPRRPPARVPAGPLAPLPALPLRDAGARRFPRPASGARGSATQSAVPPAAPARQAHAGDASPTAAERPTPSPARSRTRFRSGTRCRSGAFAGAARLPQPGVRGARGA